MKKLVYILSIFIMILSFESCTKERVELVNGDDPFAFDCSEDGSQTRGVLNENDGGIVDTDEDDDDLDEDDDMIVDPDDDDDDMDEDDDEAIDDREELGELGEG